MLSIIVNAKFIYFLTLIILLTTSCNHPEKPDLDSKILERPLDIDLKVKKECDFYIPMQYVSKNDSISLNFADSLIRYFRTESKSLVVVRHDLISDSVDILELNQSIIHFPISKSLEYSIHFDDSPWAINDVVSYQIHHHDNKKKDSSEYIIFKRHNENSFCQGVNEIVSKFNTQKGNSEEVRIKHKELIE